MCVPYLPVISFGTKREPLVHFAPYHRLGPLPYPLLYLYQVLGDPAVYEHPKHSPLHVIALSHVILRNCLVACLFVLLATHHLLHILVCCVCCSTM